MLDTFKNILWDFDGVIMDSMPIRNNGFRLVLKSFPAEQVEELMTYHLANGGLSRYHKFRYFFNDIRNEKVSENQIQEYADQFSEIMLENLINENLLITDSMEFIKANYKKFQMHIVSGSDQKELRTICKELGLDQYFISIHGSPTPKNELVKKLISIKQYTLNQTCLIGDSKNDSEAAEVNKIQFFGYNSNDLKNQGVQYINSFCTNSN